MTNLLAVAVGSVLGGVSRYYLGGWAQRVCGDSFPYGTLTVNLAGCFAVGLLAELAGDKLPLGYSARLLLVTGFCGAFTTFSAFVVETDGLLRHGSFGGAFLNVLLNVLAGFAAFRLGIFLGRLG